MAGGENGSAVVPGKPGESLLIPNAAPHVERALEPQDVRVGGRQSDSDYQYTLSSADLDLLQKWAPIVQKRMETVEGITDISADRDPGGLQLTLKIDRQKASALGVRVQDIDNALNNAFAQRQVSTIYSERNQYRVILEVDPLFQRDPSDLTRLYVAGTGGTQVPLSSVATIEDSVQPNALTSFQQLNSATLSGVPTKSMPPVAGSVSISRSVAS